MTPDMMTDNLARAQDTIARLTAQLAAANARAEHSENLLCRLFNASPVFNRDSLYQDMKEEILALRDKPACVAKTAETAPQPALCDTSEPQAYTQDDDLDDPFAKTAPEATVQDAVKSIINNLSSTYTARNGRKMTIEGDDGEMCWILSNDGYDALRAIAGGGDE